MKNQVLPIAAILASLIAVAVSLANNSERNQISAQNNSLDELDRRLQILEAKIGAAASRGDGKLSGLITTDAIGPGELTGAANIDDLRGRQQQLESRLSELGVLDHFEAEKEKVEASYAAALDPESGSKSRLEALGVLREAKRIDDQVVGSMVELWNESLGDAKGGSWTRWFLMENLESVNSSKFRDSILAWIPDEESPKMRSRAIETLGSMMPDPSIAEWLDYLGESDPDPDLRQQAIKTRAATSSSDK